MPEVGLPTCDSTKPDSQSPWPHDYVYVDDEYGSLAEGGSYEIHKCTRCGRVTYFQLPD